MTATPQTRVPAGGAVAAGGVAVDAAVAVGTGVAVGIGAAVAIGRGPTTAAVPAVIGGAGASLLGVAARLPSKDAANTRTPVSTEAAALIGVARGALTGRRSPRKLGGVCRTKSRRDPTRTTREAGCR